MTNFLLSPFFCGPCQATLWLAQAYYSKPAQDSDILAVARLTAFIKQARQLADAAEMKRWQYVPRMGRSLCSSMQLVR